MIHKKKSDLIRELLYKHGVPSKQHIKNIANLLGLHYVSAQQKFSGMKAWTDEQIVKICQHFGEPIEKLLTSPAPGKWNAVLMLGAAPQRCLVQIEEQPLPNTSVENLVAVRTKDSWIVLPGNQTLHDHTLHRVTSIYILSAPLVAALDDDARIPKSIAAQFILKGIQVQQFTTEKMLLEALQTEPFEGYIIDWIIGTKKTAEHTIAAIRANCSSAVPITVLTGELNTEAVTESDLARMVELYDISVLEKPTSLTILATGFYKKFFFPDTTSF